MEEFFKYQARDRLPVAIKDLPETHQRVFIYLRLRKTEEQIAKLLKIPHDHIRIIIFEVKQRLVQSGQLYLVEEPRFISLEADDPDEDSPSIPLAADDLDGDHKLIIREFLSYLKESLAELPEDQARILRLRYRQDLTARQILDLAKKVRLRFLIPGKSLDKTTEQDIFYALNKALQALLKIVRERYIVEAAGKTTGKMAG